jgi:hypothetical protein
MPLAVGRHHANQPGGDDRTAQEDDPIEDGTDHRRGDKKIATDVLEQRVHMALALIVSNSGSRWGVWARLPEPSPRHGGRDQPHLIIAKIWTFCEIIDVIRSASFRLTKNAEDPGGLGHV